MSVECLKSVFYKSYKKKGKSKNGFMINESVIDESNVVCPKQASSFFFSKSIFFEIEKERVVSVIINRSLLINRIEETDRALVKEPIILSILTGK